MHNNHPHNGESGSSATDRKSLFPDAADSPHLDAAFYHESAAFHHRQVVYYLTIGDRAHAERHLWAAFEHGLNAHKASQKCLSMLPLEPISDPHKSGPDALDGAGPPAPARN